MYHQQNIMEDYDIVYVKVPDVIDWYPGEGQDRDVKSKRYIRKGQRNNVKYIALLTKISTDHFYLQFASFVIDEDIAYLVGYKKLKITCYGQRLNIVDESDCMYDFEVLAMLNGKNMTMRVPEAMKENIQGDIEFYDEDFSVMDDDVMTPWKQFDCKFKGEIVVVVK